MNRQRFLTLLVVALLVAGLGLYLSTRRTAHQEASRGGPLFPTLAGQLGTLNALNIRKASSSPSVTLRKQGEAWLVAQRADYPADVSKIRKLALSLADAKIIETKTSNPANFPLIGVEDASSAGATGTQIDFTVKDGTHSLIVGKASGDGNFVRRGGENQSFTVSPSIFVDAEPKSWIDAKVPDIALSEVQRLEVKMNGGPNYSLRRLPPPPPAPQGEKSDAAAASAAATKPAGTAPPAADPGFALEGVPAGRKPANAEALAPSSSAFNGLIVDDVAPAAEVDFSKPATTTLTLKDGSLITISGVVLGDKHWVRFSGIKDAAFSARSAGRAYLLPSYRYEGIFRPLEQLLTPKEAPPSKSGAAKPTAAGRPAKPKPPATPLPVP